MFDWSVETEKLIQDCENIIQRWYLRSTATSAGIHANNDTTQFDGGYEDAANTSSDGNDSNQNYQLRNHTRKRNLNTSSSTIKSNVDGNNYHGGESSLSLKLYRLGWILHCLHDKQQHQHQLKGVYQTIQSVIHEIFQSLSESYQQRIVNELYRALEFVLLESVSLSASMSTKSNPDSTNNSNNIIMDENEYEFENLKKALQSIAQLHKSSQLMTDSLITIFKTTHVTTSSTVVVLITYEQFIKIILDSYNYYCYQANNTPEEKIEKNDIENFLSAILELVCHVLIPEENSLSLSTMKILPLDNFLQCIQLLQQHRYKNKKQEQQGSEYVNKKISTSATYCNIWDDFVKHMNIVNSNWIEDVLTMYQQNDQIDTNHIDYIRSILNYGSSSDHDEEIQLKQQIAIATKQVRMDAVGSSSANMTKKDGSASTSGIDEIQRRVDKVRQVFPHYGEGFIETALACNDGNVESTVSMLLDGDEKLWPAVLQVTDKSLPRRRRHTDVAAINAEEEMEAKATAKALILASEKEQEKQAVLLMEAMRIDDGTDANTTAFLSKLDVNEYDDDYDDQYDDRFYDGVIEGTALDDPLYDREDIHSNFIDDKSSTKNNKTNNSNNKNNKNKDQEYQAIKVYNKTLKDIESDATFWDANRNTNRKQTPTIINHKYNNDDNGDDDDRNEDRKNTQNPSNRLYRGPDKGRGGRIPRQQQHQQQNGENGGSGTTTITTGSATTSTTFTGIGGRGRGSGRDGGRGGTGSKNGENQNGQGNNIINVSSASTVVDDVGSGGTGVGGNPVKNSRQKERQLAKRREQQKKVMYNKSG